MKYLVMECHSAYAVVLSEDGQFLKVANLHYEVGQRVSQVVEMVLPQNTQTPARAARSKWIPALVSMAACMVLVFGGWAMNFMPYASVYLSINPEVRIDVSRTDRVVDVAGVNADGETLLEGYTPQSRDLDGVMDELVDRAIDMGYLHSGGKITLTLDADDAWVADHEGNLNTHLAEHLNDKVAVTIDITVPSQAPAEQVVEATSGGQTVVIPVAPENSYSESDYGETAYGDSGYDAPEADSGYDPATNYDAVTNYDALTSYGDSGQTDYGTQEKVPSPDKGGESAYKAPEPDSGYDAPDPDSGYDAPKADSGYDAPEKESDYDD